MKRLLIVGCGDIARRVVPLLRSRYRIYALIRNYEKREEWRAMGAVPVSGDLDHRASLARVCGLAHAVLHLAPPAAGEGDIRTQNLLAALSRSMLPERFLYVSTSGVYGNCDGAWVGETHRLHPESLRARRRANAELQIRSWASRNRVSAAILRVPGIYAADRLPLERLRRGIPSIVAEEDGYTNHIHADDLARIIVAGLRRAKPNRVYHASDDSELKTGDYFDAVADVCGLPKAPRIGRADAQRTLPDSLLSFMNESRRLMNERMKHELKVVLAYPTVADGLKGCAKPQHTS